MNAAEAMRHPDLKKMVEELAETLGKRLRGVVLYGSAARGDFHVGTSDFNLALVLEDLEPASLEPLTRLFGRWHGRGHSTPRLFTAELIADSTDVFPIEMLDLKSSHVVLHGEDAFAQVAVDRSNLRIQCERELRAKLMRLREGYIAAHSLPQDLRRLLTDSYTTFIALFRGCLYLLGGQTPLKNGDVVAAFCERAGLDPKPFEEVDRLKRGLGAPAELKDLFSRYYRQLARAVDCVDRFASRQGGETS